jgi:hypothetical protein
MPTKQIVVALFAVIAGLAASIATYMLVMRDAPTNKGSADADYYCYVLHQGWTCAYARADCEARLALEKPDDIEKKCLPHSDFVPSP